MAKSTLIAYILWLFFGWFGLHHFYLGRDRHAFVWWATFAGGFGLGWLRDAWRLYEYVEEANETAEYMRVLVERMRSYSKPAFSGARFAGQLFVGSLFGYLALLAVPEEWDEKFKYIRIILVPAAVAIGVHIVANIGREQSPFKAIAIVAYIFSVLIFANPNSISYLAIVCAITAQYNRSYRRTTRKRSFCARILILGCAGSVVTMCWILFLANNASVTTADGENVKLRDAFVHFYNSPAWQEFKETLYKLYERGRTQGWDHLYDEFVQSLDPLGEMNAHQVLGLEPGASQEEITKRYRKLAKEWHPDRHKENKGEAEEKFIEIQKAYETLSDIKAKRARRNRRSQDSYGDFHRGS
ncbi:dnaJ homolog subfamily C member 22-like [Ptychodera flava]|uniref:dnaJ homolog subfamily C member 22-like n=1 Tax=Ptychodera flava TaxID=63121 RepID=UPI00396A6CFC